MSDSRRDFLGKFLVGGGAFLMGGSHGWGADEAAPFQLKQSVMGWCFNERKVKPTELAAKCLEFGITGMEGVPVDSYPELKKMGMEISLVTGHPFHSGPCDPKHRAQAIEGLKKAIATAKDVGCERVITFTGMSFEGMDPEKAEADCISAWKEALVDAEKAGITLVLEHLNSRDDSHPMKGHPGYFGDDVDHCFDMIRKVGSENFKLLFDVYHVSVMNGDVIRRIRRHHELIGHYHTAGNPGRAELDGTQEINYPAVIAEIKKTKFDGWIAHEFLPTYDDTFKGLKEAAEMTRKA